MRCFLFPIYPCKLLYFYVFLFSLIPASLQASHIMAGDLTYQHLGGEVYEVSLKLYRDCSGISLGNTATVRLSSSCQADSQLILRLQAGSGQPLPLLCPAAQANSSCLGGNLLGVREFIYLDTLSLSQGCSDWTFSWSSCCRNTAISNLATPSSRGFYLEATLNNLAAPGNSSPAFGAIPTPYICINQPFTYSQGTIENDGDSLVYQLVSPREASGSPIPFMPGFQASQPMSPACSLGPEGTLQVTPDMLQTSSFALRIDEYRNGLPIGTTYRDLQFIVLSCNNIFPRLEPGLALNIQGPVVQPGPLTLEVCPGSNLSFQLKGVDDNPGDSVYVEALGQLPPGASLTSQPGLDSARATFSWSPDFGDVGVHLLSFLVRDNRCPLQGAQRYALSIRVLERTSAGPDRRYCPVGGPVSLQALGGSSFQWTYLNGGSPPPSELSCTQCPNPLASPPTTTRYVVSSNLSNCINRDTVEVEVVPDFTLQLSASRDTLCQGDSVLLLGAASPANGYTYQWKSLQPLSSPSLPTPWAYPLHSSHYALEVTSPAGCVVEDSLWLQVNELEVTSTPPSEQVCFQDSSSRLLARVHSNVGYEIHWHDPLGAIFAREDSFSFAPALSGYYRVVVADSQGICQDMDSSWIDVLDLQVPPGDRMVCLGDSAQLQVSYQGPLGLRYPGSCGPGDGCCGPFSQYVLGDTCPLNNPGGPGSQCRNYVYLSAPYKNAKEAARSQYLFRASELQAMGFSGGTIESLAFFVAYLSTQGSSPEIDELTIKIGCTSEDSLLDFEEGLTTVWGPAPFLPTIGFNEHLLSTPYDWDGVHNLVVQICSRDSATSSGFASYLTSGSFLSFPATVFSESNLPFSPCELQHDPSLSSLFERPSIRFGVCNDGIFPTYSWYPVVGLSDPFSPTPKAAPPTDTTYTVTVQLANGCLCVLQEDVRVQVDGCVLSQEVLDFSLKKGAEGIELAWLLSEGETPLSAYDRKNAGGHFSPAPSTPEPGRPGDLPGSQAQPRRATLPIAASGCLGRGELLRSP
jgi:hypothetical protein